MLELLSTRVRIKNFKSKHRKQNGTKNVNSVDMTKRKMARSPGGLGTDFGKAIRGEVA